jgi:sn-glycerol 3-phosphate transport system substrate-binding protein
MRPLFVSLILLAGLQAPAHAQQEIQFWHAMGGALGNALETLVQRFNESQQDYRVVGVHKGSYEDTMIAALAAHRIGTGPHIVQVSEIGTAHMMVAPSAYVPVWQVFADAGQALDGKAFVPAIASYFSDASGRLLALPFNVATPILFYNKDVFRKAKLDPEKPPKTWYELPKIVGELKDATGIECAYTTTWPSWVLLENTSTWHNQDFATKDNGLGGLDAKLVFNSHLMVRHVSMLSSWARAGYFTYSGRRIEGEKRFAAGECAMLTASSSSAAELRSGAKFDFGVAQLPHYDDVKGAPHHSLLGGGGLWVLPGKKSAEYRGVAKFLAYLAQPKVQAEWHQRTGYMPVTRAAYELSREQGYYDLHPGQLIAIRQLLLNAPTRESRGIRIGEFAKIREIIEEELETVWDGTKPPKLALDNAAERGNVLLRKFETAYRLGAQPAVPARSARKTKKK